LRATKPGKQLIADMCAIAIFACKRNIVMSCFSKVEMSCLCVNLQFCKLSANKDSYEGHHYYEQP